MAYTLHIERNQNAISLAEWEAAINLVDTVQLDSSNSIATNINSGEKISVTGNEGDASVLFTSHGLLGFGKKSEWVKVFRFQSGKATFNSAPDLDLEESPVRAAVSTLAKILNAQIIGDEGEIYEW